MRILDQSSALTDFAFRWLGRRRARAAATNAAVNGAYVLRELSLRQVGVLSCRGCSAARPTPATVTSWRRKPVPNSPEWSFPATTRFPRFLADDAIDVLRVRDLSGRRGPGTADPAGSGVDARFGACLLDGPVFCHLGRMPHDIRDVLPQISPNFMLPFVRRRIDPFNEPFEVTLRGEGTVRGTGGLRVISEDCGTTVPGLFAAGDAATRERVAGATSGGGAQNSAWALSSGQWAGRGAAALARTRGLRANRPVEAIGSAGLRPRRLRGRLRRPGK